jgi:hypothetical protein
VNTSAVSSATKIKSAVEGIATPTHRGVNPPSDLPESSAIAVNLIEVG